MGELQTSSFVTGDELQARVFPISDPTIGNQLSGLSRRVGALERNFTNPDRTLARLETRVKGLKDQQTRESVDIGGWPSETFRQSLLGSRPSQTRTFTVTVWI